MLDGVKIGFGMFIVLPALIILGLVVFLMLEFGVVSQSHKAASQSHKMVEVCIDFKGNSYCANAAGATSTEAIRSAKEIDCAMLSNGRDENMVCLDSPPRSVREIK